VSLAPPEHREYLRRPFAFGCATEVFPPDELAALTEFGGLLEALAAGDLRPATPEQEHFLAVDREAADPRTVVERAWVRLKGRREYEREQAAAPPPEPPAKAEDYGMIPFDADRCWW
jgi:uncharacterized protein YifE (UPF0438 family)